ncbi:MAG: hypothetical protein HY362_04200 [Candidatus Aenigmarchaeota archaeon]|nr:hypothetical protein [Candidatus Aenigmarchaeota archaeon]
MHSEGKSGKRGTRTPAEDTFDGFIVRYNLEGLMLGSGFGPDRNYRWQEIALYAPHGTFAQTDTSTAVSVGLALAKGSLGRKEYVQVPRHEVALNVLGARDGADIEYTEFLRRFKTKPSSENVQVPADVIAALSRPGRLLKDQFPPYISSLVDSLPRIETSTRPFERGVEVARVA